MIKIIFCNFSRCLCRHISSKSGIVMRLTALFIITFSLQANAGISSHKNNTIASQQHEVHGHVTDTAGNPLSGVSVIVTTTKKGTFTDADGNYRISAKAGDELTFAFVGYDKYHATVTGDSLNVILKSEAATLNEVVVVGYGTQKRSDVTGSIASVPKDRLSNLPVTNIIQAMEGAVAGVNISSSSVPGSTPTMYVRGLKSISASNTPLIVLDGTPFSGSYNDINPNDIASIDILKDVSASAIYGSRGANGVILITTKRGLTGKPTISYNGYTGLENVAHELKPMNAQQYMTKNHYFNLQAGRDGAPDLPNLTEQQNYADSMQPIDWLNEVFQQGIVQNHNLSISGGTNDVKYYVSGNYMQERGVLKGYQYHRFNLRSNVDANITPWLKVGLNLFWVNDNYDGGKANLFMATTLSPYGSLLGSDGKYAIYPMAPEILYTNPLLGLYEPTLNRSKTYTTNGYAEVSPAFLKGLKYKINLSYNYTPSMSAWYTGRDVGDLVGSAEIDNTDYSDWLVENILQYKKEIGKHTFDVTGLYSSQRTEKFYTQQSANTFINDNLGFYNLSAAQVQQTSSSDIVTALISQMLRLNYSYADKYLFTATMRRDGFSAFGEAHKYGNFPSVAIGWNISHEQFLKNVNWLNTLKLRASYGISGNQAINPYQTLTTLSIQPYIYGGTTAIGVVPNILGNPNLKWESTKGLNLGLDFGMLNNRISGTLDLYDTRTYDLLLKRAIPQITGYTYIYDNVGKTANKGLELTLVTHNIESKNFTWNSNFNISFNRNKIVALYGDNKDDIGNRLFIGKPLQAVYDYKMTGIWQAGENTAVDPTVKPGYLKFADLNNDGKIDANNDREYLGTNLPKYIAGLTNTFTYKHFALNIFIQTLQGALKQNPIYDNRDQAGRVNLPAAVPYWTSDNQINTNPSLAYTNPRSYTYPSPYNYIRIKDITLSYRLSQNILDKWNLKDLMFYVSGRNIATFTKWVGWDPEQDPNSEASQQNSSFYPLARTIVLGLNVGL